MRYIDWHCDTLTELGEAETLENNRRHINLDGLRSAGVLVQCCAMFVPTGEIGGERGAGGSGLERKSRIEAECARIETVYEREMAAHPADLKKILSASDLDDCVQDGRTGILLTIEDGGVLFGERERLSDFYEKGVRLMTLTWNHENEIACPNSMDAEKMQQGLKAFGYEVIEEMSRCGMIVDVSHLSDGGFRDVALTMKRLGRPFVASHSNARAVTAHPRNMTDEMIRVLSESGGIMGLNFAPHFLNAANSKQGESRIEDMVRHVMHIRNVGGTQVLSIGSDFDGIEGKLEIAHPQQMERLWAALHRAGMSETELEQMEQKNALRVLRAVLR